MRRTKEDAEVPRKTILDAALKVISSKGYSATRLEDIAELAGVTRGAIYWHFKNKADLYNTPVNEILARIGDVANAATFSLIERAPMLVDIFMRGIAAPGKY